MITCETDKTFNSLQTLFNGTISFSEENLKVSGQDFGKVAFSLPIAVLKPQNDLDIIRAIKFAMENKIKILARGTAHTTFGQCQCNGGIVLDMAGMDKITHFDPSPQLPYIDVQPGAKWEQVIKFAGKYELALPVTTDWQKMSIGGTISTGGIGYTSHRHGLITDNIIELDVIDGTGTMLTCSKTQYADMFDAARAGLGQYGVISRVRLKLIPMPGKMHVYQFFLTDSESFTNAMKKAMADRYFECIHAFVVSGNKKDIAAKITSNNRDIGEYIEKLHSENNKWVYFVELVKYDEHNESESALALESFSCFDRKYFTNTETYYDYITKEPPLIVLEKSQGKNPHPQLVVIQPAETFCAFIDEALEKTEAEDMGDGPILIMPLSSECSLSPMFKHPTSKFFYFTGFLKNAFPGTKDQVDEFCRKNILLYKKSLSLGGNRHPSDSLRIPSNQDEWKNHYGEKIWANATAAKSKYDPHNIFISKLNIFGDQIL